MSAGPERLVQMVNQIARFFDSQTGDPAIQTMQHLRSYWAPTMRQGLVDHLRAGGDGLGLTARKTAELLADELEIAHRVAALDSNAGPDG